MQNLHSFGGLRTQNSENDQKECTEKSYSQERVHAVHEHLPKRSKALEVSACTTRREIRYVVNWLILPQHTSIEVHKQTNL